MPRIKCNIKWSPPDNAFRAFDINTGLPLQNYSNLAYSSSVTPAFVDDPLISIKTITSVTAKTTDIYTGWCDV